MRSISIFWLLPCIVPAVTRARDILQVLENDAELHTFANAVRADPAFAYWLDTASGITILAPKNTALEHVDIGLRESRPFLSYHILQGALRASDIPLVEFENNRHFVVKTFLSGDDASIESSSTAISGWQSLTVAALGSRKDIIITSGGPNVSRITPVEVPLDEVVVYKLESALTLPVNGYRTALSVGLEAFANIILMAGLDETIGMRKDCTLLIPINEAVKAISPFTWGATTAALRQLVYRHLIVDAPVWTNNMTTTTLQTASGNELNLIVTEDGSAAVGRAHILRGSNMPIHNGVAHVISRVLTPIPLHHT